MSACQPRKLAGTGGTALLLRDQYTQHNNIPATATHHSKQPQVLQIQMDFGVNCDMTHDKDVIDLLIIHSPDSPDALIVYLALSYINRYLTV